MRSRAGVKNIQRASRLPPRAISTIVNRNLRFNSRPSPDPKRNPRIRRGLGSGDAVFHPRWAEHGPRCAANCYMSLRVEVFWLPSRPTDRPSHPFGQWSARRSYRLQRRARAGLSPASLVAPEVQAEAEYTPAGTRMELWAERNPEALRWVLWGVLS